MTATIASSRHAVPRAISACAMSDCPRPSRLRAITIAVTEALADRAGPLEQRVCRSAVAPVDVLEALDHQQEPLDRAVVRAVLQQRPRPPEPTAGRGHLTPQQQVEAEPERTSGRACGIAVAHALLVRTHPGVVARFVVAGQVPGDREQFQILDLEGIRTDTGEARECVTPLAAFEALACPRAVFPRRVRLGQRNPSPPSLRLDLRRCDVPGGAPRSGHEASGAPDSRGA